MKQRNLTNEQWGTYGAVIATTKTPSWSDQPAASSDYQRHLVGAAHRHPLGRSPIRHLRYTRQSAIDTRVSSRLSPSGTRLWVERTILLAVTLAALSLSVPSIASGVDGYQPTSPRPTTVVSAKSENTRRTIFFPIIGSRPVSPDPTGAAYVPLQNELLIVDSEIDELPPPIFESYEEKNIRALTPDLEPVPADGFSTLNLLSPGGKPGPSHEPTGAAYNPQNGDLYISDDNQHDIRQIDPGADGKLGTSDDKVLRVISALPYGSSDAEGLAFLLTPQGLRMVIASGAQKNFPVIGPGPNGTFDGGGDDQVFPPVTLASQSDPEGVECLQALQVCLGVSRNNKKTMSEFTLDGRLIQDIDISSLKAITPAGLAAMPITYPNGSIMYKIYITDRGIDNFQDPNENDGRVYKINLSSDQLQPMVRSSFGYEFADTP